MNFYFKSLGKDMAKYSVMMLVKFLPSADQKPRIKSRDESDVYHPRLRFLGDDAIAYIGYIYIYIYIYMLYFY